MKWSFGIKRRSKKKGMYIYKYDGVKVVTINDYNNRRLLVFYFKESTKEIFRVSYHFYYVRPLRKKITETVKKIQDDDCFFAELKIRRSYSYKRERAYKSYLSYQRKIGK